MVSSRVTICGALLPVLIPILTLFVLPALHSTLRSRQVLTSACMQWHKAGTQQHAQAPIGAPVVSFCGCDWLLLVLSSFDSLGSLCVTNYGARALVLIPILTLFVCSLPPYMLSLDRIGCLQTIANPANVCRKSAN